MGDMQDKVFTNDLISSNAFCRFAFIRKLEPANLPNIFRTELEPATFDAITDALRVCVLLPAEGAPEQFASDAAWTEQWLLHMSRINRFDLTLDFADKSTTTTIAGLLDLLDRDAVAAVEAEAVESAFKGGTKARFDSAALASLRAAYKL